MTNPSPYGEYPGYQQPTGPTNQPPYEPYQQQQPYPSQGYEPYQQQQPYPSQGYDPYQQQQPYPSQAYNPYQQQQQPPYAYAPGPGYAPAGPTSGMAIASLVVSLLGIGIVGVILGHLALNEINKSNGYMQGRGLAIAGLVIGYLQIAFGVIFGIFLIIGIATAGSAGTPS